MSTDSDEATIDVKNDPGPLLGLSRPICNVLHWVAVVWALAAIAGLALASPLEVLDHKPGGEAFAISERPVFMVLFAIGVIVAQKWRIIGGSIAAFTASGLVVFASEQLKPIQAIVVVVAFSVPALIWIIIDLNDQNPRKAIFGLFVAVASVLAGGVVAEEIYEGLFGPTHPESNLEALDESALDWIWSGAVTGDSFSVVARLDDEDDAFSIRLAVGEDPEFAGVWFGDRVDSDSHGIVRFEMAGLSPDTDYFYAVEVNGELDRTRSGYLRTFPVGPASFSVAIGSDARIGSNGAVFDTIRELDPLVYLIPGDFHYANIDKPSVRLFEDALDLTLSRTAQAALYRSTPVVYVWDDHDFGGDGSDRTTRSAPVAQETFRRYVPHYPLAGTATPVYQSFAIGRVRFIVTDGRAARTPSAVFDDANKTMLGQQQKAWLKRELLEANGEFPMIVWLNPHPWISEATVGADDWGGYSTERAEIADFIADNEIKGLLMLSGDAHMIAIDDGTNSDYSASGGANFPVMHSAALDRPGSTKGGPYTEGTSTGPGQFGLLTVTDEGGGDIGVSLSGRNWRGEEVMSLQYTINTGA